jgi:hypothetical protein
LHVRKEHIIKQNKYGKKLNVSMCVCLRRMTNCQTRTLAKSTWMACAISTKSPVSDIDTFAPFCRSQSHIIKVKLSTPHRKHSTSMHFPCHYRFTVGEFFFIIYFFKFFIFTYQLKKKKKSDSN